MAGIPLFFERRIQGDKQLARDVVRAVEQLGGTGRARKAKRQGDTANDIFHRSFGHGAP